MRNTVILIITFLFLAISANAQWRWSPYSWQYYGIRADSGLILPKILANPSFLEDGAIRYNSVIDSVQFYSNGLWKSLVWGSAFPTTSTLQVVTSNGNTTSNNIKADGGIDASSGTLLIGTGSTARIRTNRFIDMYGNSTGTANGVVLSFYKSNGLRTGAIGDGSSSDDNMYIATNNTADLRFLTSAGNLDSDPYTIPLTITNYTDGGRVLIGDSTEAVDILPANRLSVRGNAQVYNTDNKSAQLEFWDGRSTGGGKLRVSVGMLGQPEANLAANMDYTTRVHKYYDSTQNAIWLALAPTNGAFAVQYASKGQPNYSQPSYDIWTSNGSRYLIWGDTTKMYTIGKMGAGLSNPLEMIHANGKVRADSGLIVYSRLNSWGIDFKRSNFSPSHGFGINPGGGVTQFNTYDSNNIVYADYQFLTTKGSTTKTVAFIDGDSGNMGIGTSTSPTATVDINGTTGYNQFRLRNTYTPTGTADSNGNTGDVSWDSNYIYVKTSTGWKRATLTTF